ncbi:unnamed protein product [Meganyctiphanes norvegica]|uniref:Uncharacterized protein n=1 Tax=Meganyctiphanes norvegica TaxID=48144 RepID=A0AAV2QCB8_MEGNR
MTESDSVAKLNKYRNLKIVQAATCFFFFLISYMFVYLGLGDFGIPGAIFTFVMLISFILSTVAAIVLHCGNKLGKVGALKAFLVLGCMTYGWFDMCAGGFPLVRQRIQEIEQGLPTVDPK